MSDISNLRARDFRRLARGALRGRFRKLWLLTLVSLLPGVICNINELPRSPWDMLRLSAYLVFFPILLCGRQRVCVRALRGEGFGVKTLFWWEILPEAVAVWFLQTGSVALGRRCARALLSALVPGLSAGVPELTRAVSAHTGLWLAAALGWLAVAFYINLTWGMARYLWVDRPDLGPIEAMRESRRRMKGRRGQLLRLQLSFLGWTLLAAVVILLVLAVSEMGLLGPGETSLPEAVLDAYERAVGLGLVSMPMVYLIVSQTAFYEVLSGRLEVVPEAPEDEDGKAADAEADEADMIGEVGAVGDRPKSSLRFGRYHVADRPDIAMTPDEVVAWDMLQCHRFNRDLLRQEGVLDDYLALGVGPKTEARWRRSFLRSLLDRYAEQPDVMDEALLIAAEHGDADLLCRAAEVMDDAASAYEVPDETLLDHCLSAAMAASGGAFDHDLNVVAEAKERLGELAARLEHRLAEADPEGNWRKKMKAIRARAYF